MESYPNRLIGNDAIVFSGGDYSITVINWLDIELILAEVGYLIIDTPDIARIPVGVLKEVGFVFTLG